MQVRPKQIYIGCSVAILLIGFLLILWPTKELELKNVLMAIGTSVVASGIVALLDLWAKHVSLSNEEFYKRVHKAGLTGLFDRRDLEEYRERVDRANLVIDITGYSLRGFLESHAPMLEERLTRCKRLRVRVILVDPKIAVSMHREKLERHPTGTFAQQLVRLKELSAKHDRFEVKLLQMDLPTMIFRIDSTMFAGPYFASCPSKSAFTLQLTEDSETWLFQMYAREFEELWNLSNPS